MFKVSEYLWTQDMNLDLDRIMFRAENDVSFTLPFLPLLSPKDIE